MLCGGMFGGAHAGSDRLSSSQHNPARLGLALLRSAWFSSIWLSLAWLVLARLGSCNPFSPPLQVNAKLRTLPADSAAAEMYRWFASLDNFVDNLHFKNHSEDDEFCQTTTNPNRSSLAKNTDTEACEQLFRWASYANELN